jgi:hypothetical protein
MAWSTDSLAQSGGCMDMARRPSSRGLRTIHMIVLYKVAARQSDKLPLGRVIYHFVIDDALGCQRAMFGNEIPEVGQSRMTTDHQHLGDSVECVTGLAEEFMFGPHTAVMLACELEMLVHLTLDYKHGIEL